MDAGEALQVSKKRGPRMGAQSGRAAALIAVVVEAIFATVVVATVHRSFRLPVSPGGPSLYGFYDQEVTPEGKTFRWTGDRATFTLPYALQSGRNMFLNLEMAADTGPGFEPASANVLFNSTSIGRDKVSGAFKSFEYRVDRESIRQGKLHPADLQVEIHSTTRSLPGDNRRLGVAVSALKLTFERSRSELAALALLLAAVGVAVVLVLRDQVSVRTGAALSGGAVAFLALVAATYEPRSIPLLLEVGLAGTGLLTGALVAGATSWQSGLVAAAACLAYVVFGRIAGDWQVDDAYISYRYAWNLMHGNGLVYNPGEVVEGYTNFLWTMLAAAGLKLGFHPATLMSAVAILASQVIFGICARLTQQLAGLQAKTIWPSVAVALLAVDVSMLTYGARGSGIEAVLFAAFVLCAIAALWSPDSKLWLCVTGGLALGLGALTRPEGLLVAGILIACKGWQARHTLRSRRAQLVAAIMPFALVIVPYEVWRVSFYGYPFPNTFYAKTAASTAEYLRGAAYAGIFAGDHWLPVLLALAGLTIVAVRRGKSSLYSNDEGGLRFALAAVVATFTLYIVSVGGDWFPASRFFLPLLAPIVVLGVGTLANFQPARYGRILIAAWLTSCIVYTGYTVWLQREGGPIERATRKENVKVGEWGTAGLWLRESTPGGSTTAALGSGAIAFYSERTVIDMFGLNDLHIGHMPVAEMGSGKAGHEKADPAYVLARKPGYILSTWDDYFQPLSARLFAEYEVIHVKSSLGPEIEWLARKDWANR